ncbi:putative UPF0481 protein At3g02645 [Rhodamnia argentea]|uniref:UPF0481 protein At3g02645 n=1 Tax=Rhodamnia argentea TaxID=178133 RepID=A0ABM3GZK5_9MYRT|nr:putative UPF0481 protein At3g02645 [Rhodamnia argentea]
MASFVQTDSSMPKVGEIFDENRWVIQIRRALEEELEDETEVPVSIFSVPKVLKSSDPDLYTPQQVAIGPYYHWCPEMYEMESYKLAAAKRFQKQLQRIEFKNLVEELVKLESRVRACYHKYLDFNGETLAWMMAIDASFLLEFLQVYAIKEGKMLSRVSSRMSHLVDHAGRKSAHNAILRDIVMLENQIPLFILRKMLEFQFASLDEADNMLLALLMGFYKEVSLFKLMESLPKIQVSACAHLLDFLYDTMVPKVEEQPEIVEDEGNSEDKKEKGISPLASSSSGSKYIKQLCDIIWSSLFKLSKGTIEIVKRLILASPVKALLKLPLTILSKLPFFSVLAQPIESLVSSQVKEEGQSENENGNPHKPPSVEEIAIPSVSDLSKVGVRFLATKGNLASISFDAKIATLYLPAISLDVHSEAFMRNLVAYEACNASGPLVFTRYTELMNGIIDSDEDVKLLRERGVISNRLKSDGEAAKLWNGMSKSIRLTKVPFLDKAIEDVNEYYNGRWKVKLGKFLKQYVLGSWQFLAVLAGIGLLLLLTLHAFCSVYSCSRIFHIKAIST